MSDLMPGLSAEEDAVFAAMASGDDDTPTQTPVDAGGEGAAEAADPAPADADPPADPATDPKRPKTVPHEALHQERERRKQVEKDLQAAREERARFDERLRIMQEAFQRQNQPADPAAKGPPDPRKDPAGFNAWLFDQHQAARARAAQEAQQGQQKQVQTQRYEQFVTSYRQQLNDYVAEEPALQEAYDYLSQTRGEELVAMGYSPADAKKMLHREELQLANLAMRAGVNPGQRLVELAKRRGWKPKAAADAEKAAADAADPAKKVERIADGQSRGKSLAQAGGSASPTEMTANQLLAMSEEDFAAWTEKNPAKAKSLMGA